MGGIRRLFLFIEEVVFSLSRTLSYVSFIAKAPYTKFHGLDNLFTVRCCECVFRLIFNSRSLNALPNPLSISMT